ncbi:Allergen Ole e 1, conserved site [Trema orientale]|uniref:Allergen Ole e 1, conserved site n=1 Tax=Trema orientale TaxID=63057 RepID=A0A2P5G1Z9_TREOI|nr:Allergen Ole e 1, conserved site [Trema orientale]
MAKALLLMALCLLPALATASRPVKDPLKVEGKVYCDTCRAGFETSATTYIAGAKVRIECRERKTMDLVYSKEATTDSSGTYKMLISEDHADEVCDALLVSSPQADCATASPGRDRARVILTSYNGIASSNRYVNAMGFTRNEALAGCADVLKLYQETEYAY